MTMPDEENAGSDREARPLGADVAEPAGDDDAEGVAGPSYPPEESEPDA
jgi:hypothetical protein